ncbi:MAG: Trigger factor [Candidatus Amesbacteria bacterium GW2011_GWA2_47_11b]|uniref:Trigger factor n=3 Tax=Candidatus Amesiibacteriota TaxID=1752730 RepID=A0A0G1VH84_9BACT|nr:MAG: Trigger factor [Microgenomates group bacterium GW2011_GWC1_46_20]KKU57819.1 MAG: Trigger factor [Candidatus Amesbacteria bacterium GW2011_GWA2_47_11b]KKU69405.1 MAG: Trigger factor [Candidatus Amesbacteria bacterium GW2011_GWA1_47_20]KKU82463.1 MAG: Trigger factor [Candidatus Amesbacteria bacterium GW2011_GWC2_47_8]
MTKSSPPPSSLSRPLNGNLELTLTIPWSRVHSAYESAVAETVADTELPGFRKSKAPRSLVEPKLDRNQTLSHALGHLIPKEYEAAVKKHALKPLLHPQIKIVSGKEGEDWVFRAVTCEAPKVTLPKKLLPLDKLIEACKILIPDLLVEEEANHRLAGLVENLTQLGTSVDQYLSTKKLTAEELKAQMAKQAREDLSVEFILLEVQKLKKLPDRAQTLEYLKSLV